jgi:hypothetical protein
MKKKNLLIVALGGAAGLLCSLEVARRKRKKAKVVGNEFPIEAESVQQAGAELQVPETENMPAASGTASMGKIEDGKATVFENLTDHVIDDRGTDQVAASEILKQVRDDAFDSSNEKLALALGRPAEEIEQGIEGKGLIDGDVLMKTRALAIKRGVETE